MSYLEIKDIVLSRPSFRLEASLALEKGRTGVILGPSGCGKTSLLRTIAGLETADSGEIMLNGRRIRGVAIEKRNIGFVFQDLALFDHLNGKDNIGFGMRLRNVPRQEAASRVSLITEKLQISNLLDRKPHTMSGGEKQRLAFARVLAINPDLLLLDEPLSSLDAPLRRELRGYLRTKLVEERLTALHVTHDVDEALELADFIFLMMNGRIVARGTPEDLLSEPPDAWSASFLGQGALFSADSCVIGPSVCSGTTAFGDFVLPSSACRIQTQSGKLPAYLFVPRAAARIGADGGISAKGDEIALRGVVERTIFEGTCRRIVFRAENGRNGTHELDADPSLRVEKGQRISIRIGRESCRLLPLHCLTGSNP